MATNNHRPPLTEFAQKYGVINTSNPTFLNAAQGYKSGLTPVSAHWVGESDARKEWKDIIATFQMLRLDGFSLDWARALRAYAPTATADFASDWQKAELHNAIHPLIDSSNWETLDKCLKANPPTLVGDGHPGFMVVSVPVSYRNVYFQY